MLKRYKRFLADVELAESKEKLTVHCPNPGSMLGLAEAGSKIWLRKSKNPGNKLPYAWVLCQLPGTFVCIDTMMANKLVKEALKLGLIPELDGYRLHEPEKKFNLSRFDFLLSRHKNKSNCYVEVKSTTLKLGEIAMFPDAKTDRGAKHLLDLQELAAHKLRAVQLFLISRSDTDSFKPADHIDPKYGKTLRQAFASGVEILAYKTEISRLTEAENGDRVRFSYSLGKAVAPDLSQ